MWNTSDVDLMFCCGGSLLVKSQKNQAHEDSKVFISVWFRPNDRSQPAGITVRRMENSNDVCNMQKVQERWYE